jgi:hypothetical protein
MPLDPNIALSYKPVGLDIAGAMQAANERKLMQSRNALAGTQQAAAQDELNNALAARRYAGGADLSDPQNAMRLLGYGKEGADMFQSLQAGRASSAAARKSQLEASGVKAGQYRQALAFVDSPNAAMEWLQAHHDDPDMQDSPVARMPLDVALSRIPQDPVGFQQWKQQAALGIDEYIKRNTMTANEQSMATDRAAGRQYQQDTLGETSRHNRNQENLAREQYQSSIDPETQRRLAEAKKKGEEAAGKGPAATSAAAAQAFLTSAGYDPETGADAVSKLIPKSTGGLLQTAGAMAAGALNITTSGQEAIGQLASRSSKLVLDLLGGKLGAGVSNADREFMLQAVGDIGNSLLPTGVRLAAWNDLMNRMKTAAGGASAAASAAAGPRKTKSGVTFTVEE